MYRQTHRPETEHLNRDELCSLVRTHQVQIYRYLRYLGAAPDLAEDLAQETFIVAFQKTSQDEIVSPAAWLRGVCRNLFLAHCRRVKCSPVRLSPEALEQAESLWASQVPPPSDGSEYLSALRQCLQGLPAREREIVDLQYRLKKSRAEIAAAWGLTEDGVKTLMRRLRAALAQCIERRLRAQGSAL
jgi:RNA polymerase sigma-70 factor (ECF subfamily)